MTGPGSGESPPPLNLRPCAFRTWQCTSAHVRCGLVTRSQTAHPGPGRSPVLSVAGALAGGCRRNAAELGPRPGVRASRGGGDTEDMEAGGSGCKAKEEQPQLPAAWPQASPCGKRPLGHGSAAPHGTLPSPGGGPSPVAGPGTARERPASPAPRPVPSSLFSCLSYFFFFFCLGILSTPAKEKKKKLITEQSRVLCWQIAQGALSALIRLSWGAAARCSPRPQPAPDPRAGKDESLRAPCSGREGWG